MDGGRSQQQSGASSTGKHVVDLVFGDGVWRERSQVPEVTICLHVHSCEHGQVRVINAPSVHVEATIAQFVHMILIGASMEECPCLLEAPGGVETSCVVHCPLVSALEIRQCILAMLEDGAGALPRCRTDSCNQYEPLLRIFAVLNQLRLGGGRACDGHEAGGELSVHAVFGVLEEGVPPFDDATGLELRRVDTTPMFAAGGLDGAKDVRRCGSKLATPLDVRRIK